MANLLATKPLDVILSEAHETGEHSLKRALGPVNLITLGIGAIIGTGIFVLTGAASAMYAGPAIVLSFILAGIGCVSADCRGHRHSGDRNQGISQLQLFHRDRESGCAAGVHRVRR